MRREKERPLKSFCMVFCAVDELEAEVADFHSKSVNSKSIGDPSAYLPMHLRAVFKDPSGVWKRSGRSSVLAAIKIDGRSTRRIFEPRHDTEKESESLEKPVR